MASIANRIWKFPGSQKSSSGRKQTQQAFDEPAGDAGSGVLHQLAQVQCQQDAEKQRPAQGEGYQQRCVLIMAVQMPDSGRSQHQKANQDPLSHGLLAVLQTQFSRFHSGNIIVAETFLPQQIVCRYVKQAADRQHVGGVRHHFPQLPAGDGLTGDAQLSRQLFLTESTVGTQLVQLFTKGHLGLPPFCLLLSI